MAPPYAAAGYPYFAAGGYESKPYPYINSPHYGSPPLVHHVAAAGPAAAYYYNSNPMIGSSSYGISRRGYGAASPYNSNYNGINYQQQNDGYDNSFLYQHYVEPYMYSQIMPYY